MKRLYKRSKNKIIFGVAGGVADYFGISIDLVRVIWILGMFFTWSGLLWLYVLLAIFLPEGTTKEMSQASEIRHLKADLKNEDEYDRSAEIDRLKRKLNKDTEEKTEKIKKVIDKKTSKKSTKQ